MNEFKIVLNEINDNAIIMRKVMYEKNSSIDSSMVNTYFKPV